MNETLNRSMVLFDAAGLSAALTAAPCSLLQTGRCYFRDAHCEKSQKSPSIQLAKNARKVGGTCVSLRCIGTYDCDSGYGGDKAAPSNS
jgi:hypothetical protein